MKDNKKIIALYRYFSYATVMRDAFRKSTNPNDIKAWMDYMNSKGMGPVAFLFFPPGIYMMYSYSGIYLVIEGWKDLKLKDNRIDKLLKSPFVDRLRLFRNATFHYQKDIASWKHFQFFGTEEERTELWINEVFSEFSRFFSENTLPLPDVLKRAIKDKTDIEIVQAINRYWSSDEGIKLRKVLDK